MVPAALLRGVGVDVREGAPYAQIAISHHQAWTVQATFLEAAQHTGPALRRFPVPGLYRQDHLPPIQESTHDDQESSLFLPQTRFDIDTIHPHKEHFQPIQRALPPLSPLSLPA